MLTGLVEPHDQLVAHPQVELGLAPVLRDEDGLGREGV